MYFGYRIPPLWIQNIIIMNLQTHAFWGSEWSQTHRCVRLDELGSNLEG